MRHKTAIILVNYKDYATRYLGDCFKSLCVQTYSNFDLFIADNQSTGDSVREINKLAPTAKIISNKRNLGWAGGNNSIIRDLLNDYDYFVTLNMDTHLAPTWLAELVTEAQRSKADIIQSKILIYGKEKINSLGNRINYLGYGYCNGYGKKASYRATPVDRIDYASGCSMLIKVRVLKKIGLFREEFFMYHDDLEFCWRARLAGFKIDLAEKSICEHKYSFSGTLNLIYYLERNRLITIFSLMKTRTLLLIFPVLLPFELAMLIYLGMRGKFNDKFKALIYPFSPKGRALIKQIRGEITSYRNLSDKDIVKSFSGVIKFAEIDNWLLQKVANPVLEVYWNAVKKLIAW